MHERRPISDLLASRRLLPIKLLSKTIQYTCILFIWQLQLASALYLQQSQQQQPPQQPSSPSATQTKPGQQQSAVVTGAAGATPADLYNNGAILQALSQFAAQQTAGGNPSGVSHVLAQNQAAVVVANQTATVAAANGGSSAANSNQFVIKWIHNDPKNQMAYVSITPVNYTNLHEPRIELRYQSKYSFVSLDERTPNNTVVAAVVVNDEDSGPNGETTLSIEHGNELGHFKLVSTPFTNTIQVNGAPLSRHKIPEYNLTIVARDHGSPPKSSSSNLVIRLHASHYSPNSIASNNNAPLEAQSSSKPPVPDLIYVGAMLVVIFSAVVFLIIISCALVQRPKNKPHKGPLPPTASRARSGTGSRTLSHTTDQCSAYCLGLTSL